MAWQEVVTEQGDLVLASDNQVVTGDADPIVVIRPVWSGQSPGSVWQEYHLPAGAESELAGVNR